MLAVLQQIDKTFFESVMNILELVSLGPQAAVTTFPTSKSVCHLQRQPDMIIDSLLAVGLMSYEGA
jgi:hypothetical protein